MVSRPENRAVFIKSAISYLRSNNFDGLNLDWEFPGQMGSMPSDKARFSDLVAVSIVHHGHIVIVLDSRYLILTY